MSGTKPMRDDADIPGPEGPTSIQVLDHVQEEGPLMIDREEGEDDAAFEARVELYSELFAHRR